MEGQAAGSAKGSAEGQAVFSVEAAVVGSVEQAQRRRVHRRWSWNRARAAHQRASGRADDRSPRIGAPCPTGKGGTGVLANTGKDNRLCRYVLFSGNQ